MKRPKPSEYLNELGNVDWDAYRIAIELFVNEQESKIVRDRKLITKLYKEEFKELDKYKKALDKAIKTGKLNEWKNNRFETNDEVKERLLKDE